MSALKRLTNGLLEIQIILERAAEESQMKEDRGLSAWEAKRAKARADGTPITRARPAWVGEKDGKFVALPERKAVVRTIFKLAAAGYGSRRIAVKLIADGVPPFAPESVNWGQPYVSAILRDRRAVGEYRPRHRDGTPAGDPIPDYFPAAVTEAEWLAAREGALQRQGTGRSPKRPWTDAEDKIVRGHAPQEAVHRLAGRTRVQVDRRRRKLGLPDADKRLGTTAPRHVSLFTGLVKGAGSD